VVEGCYDQGEGLFLLWDYWLRFLWSLWLWGCLVLGMVWLLRLGFVLCMRGWLDWELLVIIVLL
jgi:hypothetical protein